MGAFFLAKSQRWKILLLLLALLAFLLGGCLAEEVPEIDAAQYSWTYIQPNIFAGSGYCTICHTGAAAGAADLSLDIDKYTEIVTEGYVATKSEVAGQLIIDPGSKETSFLYRKILGADLAADGFEGSRMPMTGPPFLSTADIDLIGVWIDGGALYDSTP